MFIEIHDTDLPARAASPEAGPVLAAFSAQAARAGGPPPVAVLQAELAGHADHLAVVESCKARGMRFLSVGPEAAAAVGMDVTGAFLWTGGALDQRVRAAYERSVRDGCPLLVLHRAVGDRNVSLWEHLLLPCRDDDGGARLLAFIKPREYRSDVLEALIEASCDGVLALRGVRGPSGEFRDAVVLMANGRAGEYLGRARQDILDRSILRLLPALARSGAWERCLRAMTEGTTERFEIQCDSGGLDTWLCVTAVPLGDGFMMSLTDVTSLKYSLFEMEVLKEEAERAREELSVEVEARQAIEAELRRLASTDALTGVLNRRGFDEVARNMTASAKRYGDALSVLAIDLDHFKRINDLHGHAAGDAVLISVARLLVTEVRKETDSVSRVGGEEFMILLPHTTAEGAACLGERLRTRILETPIEIGDGRLVQVTASFGVRELNETGDSERMLIEADAALYQAKQSGRNCVVIWDGTRLPRRGTAAREMVESHGRSAA